MPKPRPLPREGLRRMQIPIHRSGGFRPHVGHQVTDFTPHHPCGQKPGCWQAFVFPHLPEACRQCRRWADVQSDSHPLSLPHMTAAGLYWRAFSSVSVFEVNIKPHSMHWEIHRNYCRKLFPTIINKAWAPINFNSE